MADKPLRWIGTSKEDLKSFPEDARYKVGAQRAISPARETTARF